ncbi:energy-coupled thiamine transporter ThiT [Anaerococcus porci]|uniref:ECF transporter S component n=1 Tax=Anaerococcus porci TaxID=2652269 RepID=A0A6N7VXG0_9FIRM|nr:energy-coupled thiamine transporter ThiT [Anaerococcus porci]MDY3007072.1 ECF transporter S component [Anaerococcus porci]MSS78703.1 ECF transporter S component [Anaerococcus porci]
MKEKHTRFIVESGVSIALSFILSLVPVFRMPMGGSVTLVSRLPIIILSIRWGIKKGFIAAAALGFLNMTFGGYVIHPIQAILDYILSFAAIGLSGISFGKNESKFSYVPSIILSYIISGAMNVISAFFFFYDMSTANAAGFKTFLPYALAYNYSFLAADCLILIIVYLLIYDRLKSLFQKQDQISK